MATGCLSTARVPEFPGVEQFAGTTHHIGNWPHEPVVFTRLQVGVIGTGSSAIQAVPVIARQPAQPFVFQRTPNFSIPSRNQPMTEAYAQSWKQDYPALREEARRMRTATALSSGTFETSRRNGRSRAHSVTPNAARRPPPIRRALASPVSTRVTAPSHRAVPRRAGAME